MNNYCVYELIFPNGKRYIGLTGQKPELRWKCGLGYKGQLVYKPIKKYGWKNIRHIVVAAMLTQEQAVRLEKYLIGYYQSNNPMFGYNCTEGGECGHNKERRRGSRSRVGRGKKKSPKTDGRRMILW